MAKMARRAMILTAALAGSPLAAAASLADSCPSQGPQGCRQDHSLLQVEAAGARVERAVARHKREGPVTTDCASRLGESHTRAAACLVIKDEKVLLVKVPYGRHPGWDLPGGREHHHEAACETAEREVCEETGHSAKAIRKLSHNVYLCELTGDSVCTRAVDEGFLKKGWFTKSELEGLTFRRHSWGDKEGLIRAHLGSEGGDDGGDGGDNVVGTDGDGVTDEAQELDACGCVKGREGWSSTFQKCRAHSQTDEREAAACAAEEADAPTDEGDASAGDDQADAPPQGDAGAGDEEADAPTDEGDASAGDDEADAPPQGDAGADDDLDVCGCRRGQEGWSTTRHRCHPSSQTDEREAAACKMLADSKLSDLDACGCRRLQEGWSTTWKKCRAGSWTDEREAAKCRG